MTGNGFRVRPTSLDPEQVDLIIDALRGWRYAVRMLVREQDQPSPNDRVLAHWENRLAAAETAALDALTVTIPWHELSAHLAAAEQAYRVQVEREAALVWVARHDTGTS